MNIDGSAGTIMTNFSAMADIEYLKYDVTNIAYFLRPNKTACVIGVGGGRDIQSAISFGHKKIVGIELNPIFVDLLQNKFRDFVGIANRKDVTLVNDEARSYLSSSKDKFSILQMSLIDTWAATGAGAFTLSENALYTVEAWKIFLNRLEDDGIFTVSRWHNPDNLGETGRMVSLAVSALFNYGADRPSEHIALISRRRISTILISKSPFSSEDKELLKTVCKEMEFTLSILPGSRAEHPILQKILSAGSNKELIASVKNEALNFEPPTDDQPYFFNMLKLRNMKVAYGSQSIMKSGVLKGNLTATITLIKLIGALLIITLATVFFPLFVNRAASKKSNTSSKDFFAGAFYFSLIGAGFMFTEIALLQRLSLFLSHPVYTLGILLFSIIASTGLGSSLSDYLPLTKRPWIYTFPVCTAALIIFIQLFLPVMISDLITKSLFTKIIVSIVAIFPLGILMGFFFPTGMKIFKIVSTDETPWYWALNGILGVLSSALAIFVSIYINISLSFYIAATSYFLVLVSVYIADSNKGGHKQLLQ